MAKAAFFGLCLSALGIACHGSGFEFGPDFECQPRPEDQTGYLQPICEYIVETWDGYGINPNELVIERVHSAVECTWTGEEYQTFDYDCVELSCCYTGDAAIVHKETRRVVDFGLGAI